MKVYGRVDLWIHIFLTSALVGDEWSGSRTGRFTPRKSTPGTHWIGGLVDPRVGLDDVEKRKFLTVPGLELRPLGRPARSQSLYRLSCPRSNIIQHIYIIHTPQNTSYKFTPHSPYTEVNKWLSPQITGGKKLHGKVG
jgi:hypothetical protein